MDPNENLKQQRVLAERILVACDAGTADSDTIDDANRLAELVQALDQWIARGGFLPKRWRP